MDLSVVIPMHNEQDNVQTLLQELDAALSGRPEPLLVKTQSGQQLEWKNGAVHTSYETFDSWASSGAGAHILAARQALAAAYGDWTRDFRQYLTTLKAHGLDFVFRLAANDLPLEGTFYKEQSSASPSAIDSTITEHSYSELGTIAVTARNGDSVENYYPLYPQGLNDIQAYLRTHVPGVHTVAFPGTILYDENTRRLVPDTSNTATPH